MHYKGILLGAVLVCASLGAMEKTRGVSLEREALSDEALVNIHLTDSQTSAHEHEVTLPFRYARLIGALSPLLERSKLQNEILPLSKVTLAQWDLIESNLERVYGIICDHYDSDCYQEEIKDAFQKLDSKNLIALIHALDYCDIPVLLEIAGELLNNSALETCTVEQINSLPPKFRKSLIVHTILSVSGPLAAQQLMVCSAEKDLVSCVVTSNNGTIASCSEEAVRVWDLKGNEVEVGKGRTIESKAVYEMKNGNLVMGSVDGNVRVFSIQGKVLVICKGYESAAISVSAR